MEDPFFLTRRAEALYTILFEGGESIPHLQLLISLEII